MTSTRRFDKWENSIGVPYGAVLQMVEVPFTSQWSTTSTSYSLLTSASITLKFSNSKVFVFGNLHRSGRGSVQVQRNTTVIYDPPINYHIYDPDGAQWNNASDRGFYPITLLDTPAVQSPTYNFYARSHDAGGFGFNESGNGTSKIFLMEIAQ